jgi:hypothetical protein
VSHRSQSQLALRRRIEALIGIAAPVLDVVLYAGDKVSRVAGRNDIAPEPARRVSPSAQARISAPHRDGEMADSASSHSW